MSNLHAVILAGGSGSRFWPLSRELSPKQMLDVFGTESLLVSAVKRAAHVATGGARAGKEEHGVIWIVVGETLHDEVRNHLKANDNLRGLDIRYIIEPCARNTAPALALAAATVRLEDPTAQIVMLPSDHICHDDEEWKAVVAAGAERAAGGDLVTIGLRPSYPATGYGYIRCEQCEADAHDGKVVAVLDAASPTVSKVERFVEKPDDATAQDYVDSGEYLWNSGMLIANADAILKELRRCGARCGAYGETDEHPDAYYSGKIASVAETLAQGGADAWQNPACRSLYENCPSVPFDTACLETSEHVSVVAADLGWSDVGSLESLADLAPADEEGNTLIGRAVDIGSHDTLAYSESGRMIATLGLDNVMVVDSADATLVADRDRTQDVRQIVDALKEAGAPEVALNKTSLRPWGSWTMLVRMPHYHVKEVMVLPGMRLSSQSHEHRAEHWIIAEGTALVTCNGGTITLEKNESAFLPMGAIHRLENIGDTVLRVVEVATGQYLGEDDITRYDDDYGRER